MENGGGLAKKFKQSRRQVQSGTYIVDVQTWHFLVVLVQRDDLADGLQIHLVQDLSFVTQHIFALDRLDCIRYVLLHGEPRRFDLNIANFADSL